MAVYPRPVQQTLLTIAPVKIYELPEGVTSARLELINICNLGTEEALISIYHDLDDDVFNDSATLVKDMPIGAGNWYVYRQPLLINSPGAIGIRSTVPDTVIVTTYIWEDIVA